MTSNSLSLFIERIEDVANRDELHQQPVDHKGRDETG